MTKLLTPLFDPWTAHSFFESGIPFMPSVVYVVRSPLHTLSHALFSREGPAVVLSLEDPRLPGKVLRVTNNTRLTEGETLSYDQILKILLESTKVIAL